MKYCTCKGRNVADALCRSDCQLTLPQYHDHDGSHEMFDVRKRWLPPQKACDIGMFSDDHKQAELF